MPLGRRRRASSAGGHRRRHDRRRLEPARAADLLRQVRARRSCRSGRWRSTAPGRRKSWPTSGWAGLSCHPTAAGSSTPPSATARLVYGGRAATALERAGSTKVNDPIVDDDGAGWVGRVLHLVARRSAGDVPALNRRWRAGPSRAVVRTRRTVARRKTAGGDVSHQSSVADQDRP